MSLFRAISDISNVISFIAYCRADHSMMLALESTTSEYWIPSIKVNDGDNWRSELSKEIIDIFQNDLITKLHRIFKICLPDQQNSTWVYHCIYLSVISDDERNKSKACKGKFRGKLRWVNDSELIKLLQSAGLRSPELIIYYNSIREHVQPNFVASYKIPWATEYVQNGKLTEIGTEILVNPGHSTVYEQLMESAGFDIQLQTQLLKEFIFLSFPCVYMGKQAFIRFIMELGWVREDAQWVFKSADVANRNGISFREYIYFLGAVDPNTSHGGGPAELRCRYIFRFFDRDCDNVLNVSEFAQFIGVMRKSKSIPPDVAEQMKDADAIYKHLGFSNNSQLTVAAFLVAVGTLKIRGTSHIFRSAKTAQQYMQQTFRRELKFKAQEPPDIKRKGTEGFLTGYKLQVETKGYELATHIVRLQRSATLINVDQIWNAQTALSATALTILQKSTPEQLRRVSMTVFNQESASNELLKSLRYLHQLNKQKTYSKGKSSFTWGLLDAAVFAKHLMGVCEQVQGMIKAEPRLLELQSPIYVMGDLHGNLSDLISFEKVFWHLGPCLCPCNLIFLGDYVDRGAYGLEVITYLVCYKLQTPQKIYLLRGNHEIRDVQRLFSFYGECINKFGNKTGEEVFEAVNKVFDCMPLAATIDRKVFCTHGGIPPPYLCPVINAINQIPVPLRCPDQESALAWELMWNDPVKKSTVNDTTAMELMSNDGFATNIRRGTAHVFSVEALERFLNANGLSHLIRAHEVAGAGFNIQQKAKLLTVFSSSKYCGGQNEAACILADQGKLRVLRLETSS
nr:uncharacterized protein LOC111426117 [Onthophagus taurus]